jgi:hypothetical protein
VLGLVRRRVSAGSFTKEDVEKWKAELGDVVDDIVQELGPKKAAKKKKAAPRKTAPTTEPAEPEKE